MGFSPATIARSNVLKTHAAVWCLAGLGSALYLGWTLILSQPTDMTGTTAYKSDLGEVRDRRIATMALAQLSKDMRAIEGKLASQEEAAGVVLGRLSALEEKSALLTVGAAAATPGTPAGQDRVAEAKPAANLRPSEITTGAIVQRATSPALPAPVATDLGAALEAPAQPKTQHGIQLISVSNLDALRLSWSLLNERHRATLGSLETRYRRAQGKPNAPYQLIAGPIRSTTDAARICKELARTGVSCRATTFTGEAL